MEYLEWFVQFIEFEKVKMKNSFLIILSFFTLFSSCKKKSTYKVDSPQQGSITIATDESFQSVAEALTDRYMALYPDTKINLSVKKEDLAFLDLLDNKVKVVIMSRDLSEEEKQAYETKVDLDLVISKFAADAVVFVVPKNSSRNTITMDELKAELESADKNIIFDGTNSSNLNFVAQKLGKSPNELQFSIINGNKNLLDKLDQVGNKIGVISLNTFSRPYDPESIKLRESVKILQVIKDGKSYEPKLGNLANGTYPFSRILYFISNEKYFGLGSGLIRFSCTQLGQIVVSKEGLQPFNIFKREVEIR